MTAVTNPRHSVIVNAERLELIRICEVIAGDLRMLKAQRDIEHVFVSPDQINRLHRAALKRHSDAQARLRTVNVELKAANMQEQEQVRIEALRERAARRKKGSA